MAEHGKDVRPPVTRKDWRLHISIADLYTWAKEAVEYHETQVAWWREQQDEAERTLRSDGLTLRQQEVTGGRQVQAVLDPSLAQTLSLAEGKVAHHQKRVIEFLNWQDFFELGGENTMFVIGYEDVDYFRHEVLTPVMP